MINKDGKNSGRKALETVPNHQLSDAKPLRNRFHIYYIDIG